MTPASPPSNELASGRAHWWACASHSVPPAAGSCIFVDGDPVLASPAPGPIVAVLVLPFGEQPGAIRWSDTGLGTAFAER